MTKSNIICIASHKGGVGKTTTAATFGSILSRNGERTLLVDLDSQRNLTSTFLGTGAKPKENIYNAFCNKSELPILNVRDCLDIVPSSIDMGALDTAIASRLQRESILKILLEPLSGPYDWIILDCPSQMGLATVNAFTASMSIIVPISCDAYAAEGLVQLIDLANIVSSGLNPMLDIDAIFITRFHKRRKLDRLVEHDLRERFGDLVMPTKIRENATVVQAPVMSKDIYSYDPKSNGATDYVSLLEDIKGRLKRIRHYE